MKQVDTYFSTDGKWCYQLSVIDYLQTFDQGKKNEVAAKRLFKNADPRKLSAVPSTPYGHRFYDFMKNSVFTPDQDTIRKQQEEDFAKVIKEIEDHVKKQFAEKIRAIFLASNPGGKLKINWGPKKQEADRLKAEEEAKEKALVKTD